MTLGEFGAAKLFLFLHRCLVILDLRATGLYVGYISHSYSAAIGHIPCVCVSLSHTHAKYSISESAKWYALSLTFPPQADLLLKKTGADTDIGYRSHLDSETWVGSVMNPSVHHHGSQPEPSKGPAVWILLGPNLWQFRLLSTLNFRIVIIHARHKIKIP